MNGPVVLRTSHLKRLNIGKRYWDARIHRIPEDAAHRPVLEAYLRDIEEHHAKGEGLFLYGEYSVGKTFALSALAIAFVRMGYQAYVVQSADLNEAIIKGLPFDAEQTVMDRCRTVDFLGIDDLGKEWLKKGSGFKEQAIEQLLRFRSRELLPTIITTNMNAETFKERYGESAAAILLESMIDLQMEGADLRRAGYASRVGKFFEGLNG